MTRMLVAAALAMTLAGCASHAELRAGDLGSPAASVSDQLRSLAGHWQGAMTETGAFYYAGYAALDLTLQPDGTWTGTIRHG